MKNILPYPSGWYTLAISDELKSGEVLTRHFMGHELVLHRSVSGKAVTAEAYCPHLGAHLGHGGRVEGENLRCPFHGLFFDTEGVCVKTSYGTKPPARAKLKTKLLQEKNGLLLIYYDSAGRAPAWEIPELDTLGWEPLMFHSWQLDTHPQETTENSVDIGHFSVVHGYREVEILKAPKFEGPCLNARYGMTRAADLFLKLGGGTIRAEFEIHVHGLGYSLVEVEIPKFEMRTRQFVLSTPIAPGKINLTVALTIPSSTQPKKVHPLLAPLPAGVGRSLLQKIALKGYLHDVGQDFVIWQNKSHVTRPALALGDGPIGKYRQWVRQFYTDSNGQEEGAAQIVL